MRISDWSSDVGSSDLRRGPDHGDGHGRPPLRTGRKRAGGRVPGAVAGAPGGGFRSGPARLVAGRARRDPGDRKSVVWGKRVSVRVDLGGRRIIKKNTY